MPPICLAYSNGVASIVISLSLDGANWVGVVVHQKHAARCTRPEVGKRLVGEIVFRGSNAKRPGGNSERDGHCEAKISIFKHKPILFNGREQQALSSCLYKKAVYYTTVSGFYGGMPQRGEYKGECEIGYRNNMIQFTTNEISNF